METLRAASSPTSFQLRLGFRCKKSTSLIHLRMNFRPSARRIWSLSASAGSATARDGSESAGDRGRSGNSWMSSGSEADSFSGWLDKDSEDSERNRGFQGMVGAGLAGIFLAAGVTFASLALSKRSSGLRKQMEPLTTRQEVLLASDDLNDIDNQVGNEHNTGSTDDGRMQNDRGSEFKTALQVPPGKVLVPAVVDQVQGHTLSALQVLKVIEADVKPGDLCTRREYARWLVTASSVLSRSTTSKIYPAMYIENVTELAFDDVSPEDPDFPSIQGLAEAGLISSKLSRRDLHESLDRGPVLFSSER